MKLDKLKRWVLPLIALKVAILAAVIIYLMTSWPGGVGGHEH